MIEAYARTSQQLTPTMRGWARAWAVMTERYGDPACEHPTCGEVWQYMGTVVGWHEFRHRALLDVLVDRVVVREICGVVIRPGDCGGWRVYDRVRVEDGDFTNERAT